MNRFILSAILCAMAVGFVGCDDDTSSTENNSTTINEASTNEISEVVVSDLGDGNYVQINMETGETTSVNVSNLRSNNAVIIDISNPVLPPMPTPPEVP
jgi:hypothetical protein